MAEELLNREKDFVSVLVRRYCEDDVPEDQVDMYVYSGKDKAGNDRTMKVELVGREKVLAKISQLGHLEKIALRDSGIERSSIRGRVTLTARNLRELDLQGNKISTWGDICRTCRELTALRALNVSRMALGDLTGNIDWDAEDAGEDLEKLAKELGGASESSSSSSATTSSTSTSSTSSPAIDGGNLELGDAYAVNPAVCFESLRTLVVNEGTTSWKFMCELAGRAMPNLEELHLRGNEMSDLTMPDLGEGKNCGSYFFPKLKVLTLEGNGISDWAEIEKLGDLPALEHLGLNKNDIKEVRFTEGRFTSLRSISLNHNQIGSWKSIDELNRFPCITDLRFQVNPVTSGVGFSLARQVLIARIGALKSLNGSTVRPRERSDSEKTYIRRCLIEKVRSEEEEKGKDGEDKDDGNSNDNNDDNSNKFDMAEKHPRYAELVKEHGEPVLPRGGGLSASGGRSLGDDVVEVTIRCVAASQAMKAPVTRKLPLSLTIRNLKLICQQVFTIPSLRQVLFHRDNSSTGSRDGALPVPIGSGHEEDVGNSASGYGDDTRPLSFAGITTGSEILVDEKDEDDSGKASKAEEEKKKEEEMRARIAAAEERRKKHREQVEAAKRAAAQAQNK